MVKERTILIGLLVVSPFIYFMTYITYLTWQVLSGLMGYQSLVLALMLWIPSFFTGQPPSETYTRGECGDCSGSCGMNICGEGSTSYETPCRSGSTGCSRYGGYSRETCFGQSCYDFNC